MKKRQTGTHSRIDLRPDGYASHMSPEEEKDAAQSGRAVDPEEAEAKSPDYAAGSAEDEADDAPVGKEALTGADKDLPEDQAALQTDSDAS